MIGFGYKESSSTYRSKNSLWFGNDGKIKFSGGQEVGDWYPNTWYVIKVQCDFVRKKAQIWINNKYIGNDFDLTTKDVLNGFSIRGINFNSSGTSTVYFDDIKLSEEIN